MVGVQTVLEEGKRRLCGPELLKHPNTSMTRIPSIPSHVDRLILLSPSTTAFCSSGEEQRHAAGRHPVPAPYPRSNRLDQGKANGFAAKCTVRSHVVLPCEERGSRLVIHRTDHVRFGTAFRRIRARNGVGFKVTEGVTNIRECLHRSTVAETHVGALSTTSKHLTGYFK